MTLKESQAENFADAMIIIAARKTDYFNILWKKMLKELPADINTHEREKFKEIFEGIVSHMKNELFLGEEEKKKKKINPSLRLNELKIDERQIKEEFDRVIAREFPDLLR